GQPLCCNSGPVEGRCDCLSRGITPLAIALPGTHAGAPGGWTSVQQTAPGQDGRCNRQCEAISSRHIPLQKRCPGMLTHNPGALTRHPGVLTRLQHARSNFLYSLPQDC